MNDISLISVNWNQRSVMELMLKSYAVHHPGRLKLMLVDNGSTDGSKEWLVEQDIPFIDLPTNLGHEQALNVVYPYIRTKYALVVDTDVEFVAPVAQYRDCLDDNCIVAGELITRDNGVTPRIGAWFFLFDIEAIRNKGVKKFRDSANWAYDVGGWMTEQIFNHGFTHHQIHMKPGDIDRDVIGMNYGTHYHLGKMSWNLDNHGDRIDEVNMRRKYVIDRLEHYKDVNIKGIYIP